MELPQRRQLDKDYVSEIVGQPVKSYSLSEGSKKGDNVIGKMLSLTVETEPKEEDEVGSGETLHLVVKSLIPLTGEVTPQNIGESRLFNELQVYPAELKFYKEVRPLLQQVTGYPSTIPKFYSGFTDGLNDYLAMEDLRVRGYKMADKQKGLSFDEVIRVLKAIALLHAHSYAVISSGKNPIMAELQASSPLKGHLWERQVFDLDQALFFNAIIQKVIEVMREMGDGDKAAKMERFTKIGHKTMIDLFERSGESPKYFRTLIHGDLWINNVLFKYSTNRGSIEDVTFIDFQQCRFGNIYEDLLYFIFTSTTAEFRKSHLRSCLKAYHEEFSRIMKDQLGNCPMPEGFTDEELIATFYENIEYGFSYNLVGIPFQLGEMQQPELPKSTSPPPPQNIEGGPPSAFAMAMAMAEGLKQGTKNSPIALQRLKELVNEMIKLNILY